MNPISKHRDFLRSKLINKRGLNIPIQYSENKIEKKPEDVDEKRQQWIEIEIQKLLRVK